MPGSKRTLDHQTGCTEAQLLAYFPGLLVLAGRDAPDERGSGPYDATMGVSVSMAERL